MSDIRSFFGGKAAAPKPVVTEKTAAPAKTTESTSAVETTRENASTLSATTSDEQKTISCPIVNDTSALPNDVQNIITWKAGEPVPYLAMVETFEEISKVGGRLEKENLFARLFRAVIATTPADLDVIVYLASNEVSPVYEGKELGIGDSLLVKAVCAATGRNKAAVEEAYEKEGDLGTVALNSRASQKTLSFGAKPKPLMAREVLTQFRKITETKGTGSQGDKVDIISKMAVRCQGSEAKYIVRALQGKLRIGTAQQTVLVALAHAFSDAQMVLVEGGPMESVRRRLAEQLAASGDSAEAEGEAGNGAGSEDDEVEEEVVVRSAARKEVAAGAAKAAAGRRRGVSTAIIDSDDEEAVTNEPAAAEKMEIAEGAVATETATTSESAPAEPETVEESAVPQDLFSMIDVITDKATPESVKMKAFALALYPYSVQKAGDVDAAAQRAYSAANRKLPKELRWQCAEVAVKRAFSECPNLSLLVRHMMEHPLHELHRHSRLTIGLPVAPMLAKPTKEIGEVLRRLSGLAFTMEYKYDGERAQVHLLEDGSVKIYSRNSEDNSEKYPDLRDIVRTAKLPEIHSCILDAEVVAYDREQKCLLPFQVLSTRKRKVEAGEEDSQKVKVILQIFDLLYVNGKSLLRESLRTRRTLMQASFVHTEGLLHFASGLDHVENGDTAPIETFLQEACAAQCEGLMVKTLDDNASYEPSKRSLNWLKLKKDYIDGMGVCDSVDLVVIGGYLGRGKRTNTYGAYLMACYDPDRDEYQSVCKVGTGFKDEDLARLYAQMKPLTIGSHRRPLNYNVNDVLTPDHWFEAAVVWELQAADLSKSSVHSGGMGRVEAGRGIGLRFPRYIRDREDKKAEGATTAEQIVDMFHNQGLTSEGNGKEEGEAVDDDWL